MSKDINRLKVVLAEKKRTNKWLAEQLGKDPATVSKWCTNTIQPNVETLVEIAKYLNVEIQDLFWPIETMSIALTSPLSSQSRSYCLLESLAQVKAE